MYCVCVCSAVKSESGMSTPRLNHLWTTFAELCAGWNWMNQRSGAEYYGQLATPSRNGLWKIHWKSTVEEMLIILAQLEGKCFLAGDYLENIPIHVRLVNYKGACSVGLGCCQAPGCWGVCHLVALGIHGNKDDACLSVLCHSQLQKT